MTQTSKIPKRIYSPNEFAKISGYNADSIRKACQGVPGYTALLDGWTAKKSVGGRGWEIHPNSPNTISLPVHQPAKSVSDLCEMVESYVQGVYPAQEPSAEVQFGYIRSVLFAGSWESYIKGLKSVEISRKFREFEKTWLNALSDQELAEAIVYRWSKGVQLEHLSQLAEGLSLLEYLGPYGAAEKFKNATALFSKIREAYRTAVDTKKPVRINLTIAPDASWKAERGGNFEPDSFYAAIVDQGLGFPNGPTPDSLAGLFCFDWMRQLAERAQPNTTTASWDESPYIQNHEHIEDFRRRCISCGKKKSSNMRRHAKFCPGNCRTEFWKWLNRLIPSYREWWTKESMKANPSSEGLSKGKHKPAKFQMHGELEKRILQRLATLEKTISK